MVERQARHSWANDRRKAKHGLIPPHKAPLLIRWNASGDHARKRRDADATSQRGNSNDGIDHPGLSGKGNAGHACGHEQETRQCETFFAKARLQAAVEEALYKNSDYTDKSKEDPVLTGIPFKARVTEK